MFRGNQTLHLSVGTHTDPGRVRANNQDWWGQFVPPDPRVLAAKGALFVVADGMGGRAGGQVASQLAVQHLLQAYYRDPSHAVEQSLVQAIRVANRQVYNYGQYYPAYQGMATTLVAAVVHEQELVVAHVGDSRAYLARANRVWPLTRDHSWVADMVAKGMLTPAEAGSHPYRHVISRSVGPQSDVQAEVRRLKLVAGDALILCTDGLSDVVTPGEIGWAAATLDPQRATQTLVDWANHRGGPDNVSAVVVRAERRVVQLARQGHALAWPLVIAPAHSGGCSALAYSDGMVQLLIGTGIAAACITLAMVALAAL